MAKLIDTNLIIRFLIKDDPDQFEAAQKLFSSLEENLILPDMVLAEIVWTLHSVYKLTKQEIIEKLLKLLELKNFTANFQLLTNSLLINRNYNVSFVDAYLIAFCEQNKLEGIYSFDKGLDKIKSVKRFKP
ncbi:MAG: PIN domain-containing protein [Candidatus Daviesbacteria bacterium]|nr:PIN domain-containing protein [Candidatus Daviesbacteria bacterium]